MRKRYFFVILIVVLICCGLAFTIFTYLDKHETSYYHSSPEIIPENHTQTIVSVTTNEENEGHLNETYLEIYDPNINAMYRIFKDQAEYAPLLDNMTAVLQSIKSQIKCHRSYDEFQIEKRDYRYAAVIAADNVSGRYCYNNISTECMNLTADEFTVLLQKKTGNRTDTGCGERGLIFAYRQGTDAGIWDLWGVGEEDNTLLDTLNRNVQDIIEHQKSLIY